MNALLQSLLAFCLIASAMSNSENQRLVSLVARGSNTFGINLFKEIIASKNQENLICSPVSVNIALSMALAGAGGTTQDDLISALALNDTTSDQRLDAYKGLVNLFNDVENVTLRVANKLFLSDQLSVKDKYKQDLQEFYRSEIQLLDFLKNPEMAVQTINQWCAERTNDRIKDIVSSGDITVDTALVLANAVYFKGKWAHPFDVKNTMDRPFHLNANVVKQVPTMYMKEHFKFAELKEHKAKCIELPYANKDISMLIVLPDEIEGLNEITGNLANVLEDCRQKLSTIHEREVRLFLPKFKVESKMDIGEILKTKLNLQSMFERANFAGISDVPLQVSKVVQKAFIEVNEEGSEAAAVTAIRVQPAMAILNENIFDINRSFYYFIDYKSPNVPLFEGLVIAPEA